MQRGALRLVAITGGGGLAALRCFLRLDGALALQLGGVPVGLHAAGAYVAAMEPHAGNQGQAHRRLDQQGAHASLVDAGPLATSTGSGETPSSFMRSAGQR